MAYVAVKGGEAAIAQTDRLLQQTRRGDPTVPELELAQIEQQLGLAVDRVMAEGSLYDRNLAALAIKQAMGDLVEAIFLLRAYRTTLPRLYTSLPLDTAQVEPRRRVSAIFKDVPGGQVLGPTFDYTYRLLDFSLAQTAKSELPDDGLSLPTNSLAISHNLSATVEDFGAAAVDSTGKRSPVLEWLVEEGLVQPEGLDQPLGSAKSDPPDLTRQPLTLPADRATRLQNLARGDEGFLLGLAYSTQRGYGNNHPFAGEVRMGEVEVRICPEELGFPVVIGEITITEVQMINQFKGNAETPPQFTRGYGLTFGHNERKAMAMALVDRALRSPELGETIQGPAQDEEFVLYHSDNIEAQGFVQHLKLPHYIDFQAELNLIRSMREKHERPPTSSPSNNSNIKSYHGFVKAVSLSATHRFSKVNQAHIQLIAGLGVEGDAHAGETIQHRSRIARDPNQPNLRQVHLIHAELHTELQAKGFAVAPGQMGENITTQDLDLLSLPTGTKLHLGKSAVVEVTGLRNPCQQLDQFQPGLMAAVLDRDIDGKLVPKAGIMGVILVSGEVVPGDPIRVELPPKPHSSLERV